MEFDVVIIGAGLGGLECGYILSKNGMNVCIVEKNTVLGGCLQTFKRGTATFDTGFHYVGAMNDGESLNRLFSYFNLLELPWKKLDDEFDTIIIDGERYPFMGGHKEFAAALTERFPNQKDNIKHYVDTLKSVGDHIFDSLNPREDTEFYSTSLFSQSAYKFLTDTITDSRLRDVLCGASIKMELSPNLPLYTFAQINDSFIRGAYRLDGGGSLIAEHLAADIEAMGGTIIKGRSVTSIKVDSDGAVDGVIIDGDEFVKSKWVISNAHPSYTVSIIEDTPYIKRVYRTRIQNLKNTVGTFTANIRLKPDVVPYLNKNLYVYENADMWN
ncbi:MAG: NAD(P)-binding protein, partial [Paludibacteraceae bacterium]|nr:NAD(P)-binding protein [Paludibacteraceae bacterium]